MGGYVEEGTEGEKWDRGGGKKQRWMRSKLFYRGGKKQRLKKKNKMAQGVVLNDMPSV